MNYELRGTNTGTTEIHRIVLVWLQALLQHDGSSSIGEEARGKQAASYTWNFEPANSISTVLVERFSNDPRLVISRIRVEELASNPLINHRLKA